MYISVQISPFYEEVNLKGSGPIPKTLFTSVHLYRDSGFSQVVPVVENPPANAGDIRHTCLISGSGRSPGGGNGNLLSYSCLENPMDRGVWWATAHGGSKESDMTEVTSMHPQRPYLQIR